MSPTHISHPGTAYRITSGWRVQSSRNTHATHTHHQHRVIVNLRHHKNKLGRHKHRSIVQSRYNRPFWTVEHYGQRSTRQPNSPQKPASWR